MRATVVETAKTIRKELKEAFPGITFSVRSRKFAGGDAVDVTWEMGPSDQQVTELVKRYQDGHFDAMTDCYERAKGDRPGGAKYVDTHRSFPDAVHEDMRRRLTEFGCDLVEHDTLPWKLLSKTDLTSGYKGVRRTNWTCGPMHEFYEIVTGDNEHDPPSSPPPPVCHRCEKEIPGGELKLYCDACEAEMKRMDEERRAEEAKARDVAPEITEVEGDFRVTVIMPKLNKQYTIERIDQQIAEASDEEQARITHVARFTDADYDLFTNNLMLGYEWLDGKGGASSDYEVPFEIEEGRDGILELRKRGLLDEWRAQAYIHCVLCENESGDQLVVDPQGYNYARYAGRPKEPITDLVPRSIDTTRDAKPETPEEPTVTLEPYHDITAFCGTAGRYAYDHVHYDPDRKCLMASNGAILVLAPCDLGDSAAAIPQEDLIRAITDRDGQATDGLPAGAVGNDPTKKFPDPAVVPTPAPATAVHFGVENLKALLDYAAHTGYTFLTLLLDPADQTKPAPREPQTPVKFALSSDKEGAEVVGAIQPLESDHETNLRLAKAVHKAIAKQTDVTADAPPTVSMTEEKNANGNGKKRRNGARLADVKPEPLSDHAKEKLASLSAKDKGRVKLLTKSRAAILVEAEQERAGALEPGKAAARFQRFLGILDKVDERQRPAVAEVLGLAELRQKIATC